jgi:DNA polymerase-4
VACLRRELPEVHPARPGVFGGRWSGGDRFLPDALERARRQLAPLRLPGGWGIGAGAAAAEIAAARSRAGELVRIERGNERPFLADLPLALLPDLDDAQCDALAEVGVRTFRDAAALPEAVLRSLLGPDGPALRRIALTGRRPPTAPGWRERRRLAEDEDDPAAVRSAVADLVAQALAGAEAAERSPGPLALTLVYADRRRSSGRIPPSGRRHEGHWQRAAMKLVMELWTRRVRIAEVRVSLRYGPPPSHQLQLFVPPHRQEREGRLAGAVSRVRGRWGTSTLHFAAAHIVPENGERGRAS